ncbi:NIPSNAP family protein [Ruixingdingia sedimenti]|uniref:NIPSNAP family protein n=1 Tax=Ruixingdingia sedimenti TaxID=3073604 RepID=A0ABU1FAC8_9RHOB|nr:NIPSNAP family protein [Xinfangfangia sp. LG-4]MDR5653797.1 NIPSNAP family protein [Xinfangfangia sp. LG-4]
MLIERRAYTLRRGCGAEFWALQHDWNRPDQIQGYLECNLGYFEVQAGPAEQVVHLQRYDDFADWRARVAANQAVPGRGEYYGKARALLRAQENAFFTPAPDAALSPLWHAGRDWRPGQPGLGPFDAQTAVLAEETVDLMPGTGPAWWAALRDCAAAGGVEAEGLVGMFQSLTGELHRVLELRLFPDMAAFRAHQAARAGHPAWVAARAATAPLIRANRVTLMSPSPVPWMRALLAP